MTKHVVYVISDERGTPTGRFLGIADSSQTADDLMEKWWKAFDSGEKAKPMDYGGISYGPVSDFEEWPAPEDVP